jgi:Circadian oscillating protein COP23
MNTPSPFQFLITLTLLSVSPLIAPIAHAQTPNIPTTSPSPTSPTSPAATVFECLRYEPAGFATIARRSDRVTPPMITWTSTLGGFSAEERCNIVSDRLTRAVANTPEGKLKNMKLTYGRVNGSPVICYVNSDTEACNNRNLLLTLRPEDRGQERAILRQMVTFSVTGSGSAIQQSEAQDYAPLGEAVEAQLSQPNEQAPTMPTTPPPSATPPTGDRGI